MLSVTVVYQYQRGKIRVLFNRKLKQILTFLSLSLPFRQVMDLRFASTYSIDVKLRPQHQDDRFG